MVRSSITRRSITEDQKLQHAQYLLSEAPSDSEQIAYIRNNFPNHCADAQIFQIFQILNNREHHLGTQIRNSPRSYRSRSPMSQTQQVPTSTTTQGQRQQTNNQVPM